MSAPSTGRGGEQDQSGLFGEGELPAGERVPERQLASGGSPRLMHAQRDQVELRAVDLDAVLSPDHAARTVWAFVQSLDLAPLYAGIKSVQGRAGAPAIDPAILVALWLWATIDGVGSAREIDRLCDRDDAYRWLCGGVGVNYHTLADFRTAHEKWLDAQLTRSIASLLDRRLVTLEIVAQDGMRVRAAAKAASFRRRDRLAALHAQAQAQVAALKRELDEDAGASSRRKQAARQRAAADREQRLAQALATMNQIEKKIRPAKQTAAPARKDDDNDPPSAPASAAPKPEAEPRVSTTDPQARVMKMPDGGYRPAFNAQLAVDTATQLIAAVDVVDQGSDMNQMVPMHKRIVQRYQRTPQHWLADGGFTKLAAIEHLSAAGTQPLLPPPKSRNPQIDSFAPKATDTEAQARWRITMASDAGKALYKLRAATVECANAQLRRRRLDRFNVRGLIKARAVLLWHALAHNLMRMHSLKISFGT
jgi:transposase